MYRYDRRVESLGTCREKLETDQKYTWCDQGVCSRDTGYVAQVIACSPRMHGGLDPFPSLRQAWQHMLATPALQRWRMEAES